MAIEDGEVVNSERVGCRIIGIVSLPHLNPPIFLKNVDVKQDLKNFSYLWGKVMRDFHYITVFYLHFYIMPHVYFIIRKR